MFAEVAIDAPLMGALTYRVPDELVGLVEVGQLVRAPFRHRSKTGLVLGISPTLEDDALAEKVRELEDIIEREPLFDDAGIRFLRFVSEYYFAPFAEVLRTALPASVRPQGLKRYTLCPDAAVEGVSIELALAIDSLRAGPRTIADLREATGCTFVALAELEERGLVEVDYAEQRKVRAKNEQFYHLAAEPTGRLGSTQAAVIEAVRAGKGKAVSRRAIRERVSDPSTALNKLVERGVLGLESREVFRDALSNVEAEPPLEAPLTSSQRGAVESISAALHADGYAGFVLHGVTGSGKTRVYVEAIREAVRVGKTALVLLPEIALTPQFVGVFRGYFPMGLAVLHSGLSVGEKFDEWRRVRRGEAHIVVGARSALFAPLSNVGVIVVDEEHDSSFKQDESPRYNARDMAIVRASFEGAALILGSATPSLESYWLSRQGKLGWLPMPERVSRRPLPTVELVDLREREAESVQQDRVLSQPLSDALDDTVASDRQAILFLNRRGFAPCMFCDSCGHVWRCEDCDVSLTYHRGQESLRCHHCDYSIRTPERCPECETVGVGQRGFGTEQLEDHVRMKFPRARVARLDADTGGGKRVQELIARLRRGEVDILVGTQMVTKGHDYPGVVTVGVVLADLSLHIPDFRSAERTFQLLTQVAGRAGRGEDAGRVFVQTLDPEHYSLVHASHHDFGSFVEQELQYRERAGYPPFGHLISMRFESRSDSAALGSARDYASAMRQSMRHQRVENVRLLGPALAPIERLRGRTRWQLLLKSLDRGALRSIVREGLARMKHFDASQRRKNVRVIVDVDPLNFM